jgi:hypothetical protein
MKTHVNEGLKGDDGISILNDEKEAIVLSKINKPIGSVPTKDLN